MASSMKCLDVLWICICECFLQRSGGYLLQKCTIFTGKKFHGSLKVWKKHSLLIDLSKFSKIISHYALTASAHDSGSPVYNTADLSGMTLFVFNNTCSYYFNWIEENKVKFAYWPLCIYFAISKGGWALLVYHRILYIHPYVAKCCGSMSTGSGYAKNLWPWIWHNFIVNKRTGW